jgi:hypothetical protein
MQTKKDTTDRIAGHAADRASHSRPPHHTRPGGRTGGASGAAGAGAGTPAVIDLSGAALGLPAPGGEREWVAQNFLPFQRELGAWLRAGAFPDCTAQMPNLFSQGRVSAGKTAVCDTGDAPLWFIGDLHGDFLALLLALNLAHTYDHSLPAERGGLAEAVPSNLFFLGDFVDEGPHTAEIMSWLLASCMGRSFGGRRFSIMALLGNHDEGLAYDEGLRGFWSYVSPANFFTQLNTSPDHALAVAFGRTVCAFFRQLPRMALLNGNTLAVHGGVPHAALTATIRNAADLETPDALTDYTWGRLLEDRPDGIPGRRAKTGAAIGWREFDRFIEVFARIKGAEPRLLLRGHDHKPRNFKWLEHYENCRVLTLNNFTVNERGPKAGGRHRPVTLARLNRPQSDPLDIHVFQFDLPPALIEHCHLLPSILENITP